MSVRLAMLFVVGFALASPHNLEARQVGEPTSTLLVIQTVQVTSSVYITRTPGATPPGPLVSQSALVTTTVYATAPGPLVSQSALLGTRTLPAMIAPPLVSQSALTSAAPPPPLVTQPALVPSSSAISYGAAPPTPLVAQTSLVPAPTPARSSPPVVSGIPPAPLVTQPALISSQPAVGNPSVAPVPVPQPQASSRANVAPAPGQSSQPAVVPAPGAPSGAVTTTKQPSANSAQPSVAQYTGAAYHQVSNYGYGIAAGLLGLVLV